MKTKADIVEEIMMELPGEIGPGLTSLIDAIADQMAQQWEIMRAIVDDLNKNVEVKK